MTLNIPIVTIDGPSGTGKGTIAQMLARNLGWHYLDSGTLYRVLAHLAIKANINPQNVSALVQITNSMPLRFDLDDTTTLHVYVDDCDITHAIRSESCGQMASIIAAIPEVREALLKTQREFLRSPGLVTDGRDMGTVVFPNAGLKIYLDASVEERAKRRYLQLQLEQLKNKQNDASLVKVVNQLIERDGRDASRACSPLKAADDARLIDTTNLTIKDVFNQILSLVKARFGGIEINQSQF